MNSANVVTGTLGCTTRMYGSFAMMVTGTNCDGSNGRFGKKLGLMTSGPCGVASRVYPAGSARETYSAPRFCAAPERFSITTGWPSLADRCWPRMRGITSPFDPGDNGTTMRIGLLG